MKFIITCFITVFISEIVYAQDDIHIIDSTYPYKVVSAPNIPKLEPGNYLFKTDVEYFNFLNSDFYNPILLPCFFSYGEMGLIIQRRNSSLGTGVTIGSIMEGDYQIIVHLIYSSSSIILPAVNDQGIFVKLKRSDKEVIVYETKEQQLDIDDTRLWPRW